MRHEKLSGLEGDDLSIELRDVDRRRSVSLDHGPPSCEVSGRWGTRTLDLSRVKAAL